jgi:TRAP-type C4-dicarboxylate transport system permease small subunit
MMQTFTKISGLLYRLTSAIAIGALIAMTLIVCANIFARSVFNASFSWSEEVARFLMIWAALCGAAMAVRRGAHFRMDLSTQFGLSVKWLDRLPSCAAVGIGMLLFWQGLILVDLASMQLATGTQIPMSIPYLCLPISGFLMMVFGIEALLGLSPAKPLHGEILPE